MTESPEFMWIALHAEQGGGKDHIADTLVRDHGFVKLAFADRLKEMALALNPVVGYRANRHELERILSGDLDTIKPIRLAALVADIGWDQAKRENKEVRRTLTSLANEVVQDFVSQTFFADEVMRDGRGALRLVIPDLRFEHEWTTFMDCTQGYGKVWWVRRLDNPHKQHFEKRSESWHPPRYVPFVNPGTPEGLAVNIVQALDGMIEEVEDHPVAAPVR